MKVINFFAGPGAGKSTMAAGLFYLMKSVGLNVELVTEYAKELVWARDFKTLDNQALVTMEQYRRVACLCGQVDYVITDSPILLGKIYAKPSQECVGDNAIKLFQLFNNINFVVNRVKPYVPAGRRQSEESARFVDTQIHHLLYRVDEPYLSVPGNHDGLGRVFKHIEALHAKTDRALLTSGTEREKHCGDGAAEAFGYAHRLFCGPAQEDGGHTPGCSRTAPG